MKMICALPKVVAFIILLTLAVISPLTASADDAAAQELLVERLLTSDLAGVDGKEIIVSRVVVPPNSSLPKHWHPGEEFGYVISGTVTLWQEGKPDITNRAGEAVKIPLNQVHTAITGDEAATLLVFRVHEKGQPERVLIEE